MGFQQTIVEGYLGSDPEPYEFDNGDTVVNFSVACNEKWTDANGDEQERVTWYRVGAWGAQGDACAEYLHTGSHVLVIGKVSAGAYINDDDEAVGVLNLRAFNVRFLGDGDGDGNGGGNGSRKRNGRGKGKGGSRRNAGGRKGKGKGGSRRSNDKDIPF